METKDRICTPSKTTFIINALENGWRVEKKGSRYVFTKKHEGQKEIYMEDYLENFIKMNLSCTNNVKIF